jgi:hypothetical protein
MLMGICFKGGFDSAQACDSAQLGSHHRHEIFPAFERLVVGIAVMQLNNLPKWPSINRIEEFPKDAINVSHARPFLSLDNQKVPGSHWIRRACAAA